MPFTLAHPAAVLPFRRWLRVLPFDALIVGSMAPDFEYMLRLRPAGSFAHSFLGISLFTLPVSVALVYLGRLYIYPRIRTSFGFSSSLLSHPGFLSIVIASFFGIVSHIAWDLFTHAASDGVVLWPILATPAFSHLPIYKCLQYTSSVLGLALLWVYFSQWRKRESISPHASKRFRTFIVSLSVGFLLGGIANATRAHSARTIFSYFATGGLVGLGLTILLLTAISRPQPRPT